MAELTLADRRSLALHRAVVERLAADPGLLRIAHANLARAIAEQRLHAHYADQWQQLLALPLPQLMVKLVDEAEPMRDLRATTMFAGVLPPRERWKILRETR